MMYFDCALVSIHISKKVRLKAKLRDLTLFLLIRRGNSGSCFRKKKHSAKLKTWIVTIQPFFTF